MKKLLPTLLLLANIMLANEGFAQRKVLKIASFEMDPYISKEVETGYFRGIVEAVFKDMGYELSFEFYPFHRAPKMVESGAFDFVGPAFETSEGNDNGRFVYSEPILLSDFGFVTLGKTEKKEAIRDNASGQDLVSTYLRPQLSTDTIVQQLDMLRAGRVDRIYLEKYLAAEVLVNKRPTLIQTFQFESDPNHQLKLRIAAPISRPDRVILLGEFNKTLARLKANGSLDVLLEKAGYKDQESEQDALNIAIINGAGSDLLKKLSPVFFQQKNKTFMKMNWTMANHGVLRTRILRSLAFKSSNFDIITLLSYDASIFASYGWIEPFDDLDAKRDTQDFIHNSALNYVYNDKVISLPFITEVSATYYRKDIFKKKNLKISQQPSYAEIGELAAKLHDPAKKIYGICMQGQFNSGDNLSIYYAMAISNEGIWLDSQWNPMLNSKPWVEALQTYVSLLHRYGPPDAAKLDFEANRKLFAEGRCAMWVDTTSSLVMLRDPLKSKVIDKFDLVSSPHMKILPGAAWYWTWSLAVSSTSKHKALAKEFVKWASSTAYVHEVARSKGWQFVPSGIRRSTESNQKFRKAEPYADYVSNTLKNYRFPPNMMPPQGDEQIRLFFEIWPAIGNALGRNIQAVLEARLTPQEALDLSQQNAVWVMFQSGFNKVKSGKK